MRVFDKFPVNSICPLCKSNKKGQSVLIAIVGTATSDSKFTYEATVVHLNCLNFFYDEKRNLIYQMVKP